MKVGESANMDYEVQINFIDSRQSPLILKATDCVAQAFSGVKIADKLIRCPLVHQLKLQYNDIHLLIKQYIEENFEQGYCAVAQNEEGKVVGAILGNTLVPSFMTEVIYEGRFSNMNILRGVLDDIAERFLIDYAERSRQIFSDGDFLHLYMIGVTSEYNRQQISDKLIGKLLERASERRLKFAFAECTSPKTVRIMEKYFNAEKYKDINGNYIAHKYQDNPALSGIPTDVSDGAYIVAKVL